MSMTELFQTLIYDWKEWLGACLVLMAIYWLPRRLWLGSLFNLAACAVWLVVAIPARMPGLIGLQIAIAAVTLWNLAKLTRER